MADNKSAVESFLGSLEENKDSFVEHNEDPFGKTIEPKEEVIEEREEKPLPFNKDPKVQKFIEKEINKRMAEFTPTESKQEQKKENDEVVDALEAVIGNDTPEKRRAVQALRDRLDESANEVRKWKEEQREAEIADKEAEEELSNAFDTIEETYDVDLTSKNPTAVKIRQEFVSFVEKIAPKDRNGDIVDYPDMQSAWETFSEIKKSAATPSRAKELASRSMARSSGSEQAPQQRTNRSSFESTDNFLESLGK